MRGVAAMLGCLVASGCLQYGSHRCDNADHTQSWLCPQNLDCALAPTYCGSPGQIEPCVGKQDFDACTFGDGSAGVCHGNTCETCTPDLVGCAYHGWTSMTSSVTADLRAVWVASTRDAFAGGANATMLHYDGIAWTQQAVPVAASAIIAGIWGTSPTDVYAVAGAQVVHYDGSAWIVAYTAPKPLDAISGAGGLVTAVGANGTIATFDGSSWAATQMLPLGYVGIYYGVSASGPDNVFATGTNGWVARLHGGAWDMSRATTGLPNMNAIWAGADEVFAVGDAHPDATTYHFAASAWTTETIPTFHNLFGVWASDAGTVFASGQSGAIYRRTNATWSAMPTPDMIDMRALGGSSATDVFAVGVGGAIWHYAGD